MGEVLANLRYAIRLLRKSPAVSLAVIIALALGIGANAAIFSVLSGLFFQPLPFPSDDRLVQLLADEGEGELSLAFGEISYNFWQRHSTVFDSLGVYDVGLQGYNLSSGNRPEFVQGIRANRGFFETLGLEPRLGRFFSPEEDRPGGARVAVLSDGLWQRRFGGDKQVVGTSMLLNDESYQIIGVMSPSFEYPDGAELWVPLALDPASESGTLYLMMTGRLKDGISLSQGRERIQATARQFTEHYGVQDEVKVTAEPLRTFLYGDYGPTLLLMLLAVTTVLLVACANVTNLQLARASGRQHEVAVRRSLGAPPKGILRQLMTESVVLALIGGAVGLGVAMVLLELFQRLSPVELSSHLPDITIDWRVLVYTFVVSVVAGGLAGLAPALQASRLDINRLIKDSSTISGGREGWSGHRVQYSLVVVEIALTLILLVATGLLLRSFWGLVNTPPGFESSGVEAHKVLLPSDRYGTGEGIYRLEQSLLPELEGSSDIRRAALANTLPLEQGPSMTFSIPERYVPGTNQGRGVAEYRTGSPGFFEALRIPLARGRLFGPQDRVGAPGVVVINQAAANRFFPDEQAVGRRIHIGIPDMASMADPEPREVIGIVGDVREAGLEKEVPPILYVPISQVPSSLLSMLVQYGPITLITSSTQSSGSSLHGMVEKSLYKQDPGLLLLSTTSLDTEVSRSVGSPRFNMTLLGALACFAFLLSALGIYGILTYLVARRRREIGVRMALGGEPSAMARLVLRQGMMPVLLGIAFGLAGALFATRLLTHFIYGISATDPLAFFSVVLLVSLVSLFSVYLPARRASRVDPGEVLRPER